MTTIPTSKYYFPCNITVSQAEVIGTVLSWDSIALDWLAGGVGLRLSTANPAYTLLEEVCKLQEALYLLGEAELAQRLG